MIVDDIYAQKCAEPSDINEHLPVLKEYALRCKTVTEFGVRGVVSTWALISGRPISVTSYDLVSPGDEVLCNVRSVAKEAGVNFTFWERDVLGTDIMETDLLFVDTFHAYQQLKQELNRHAGNVRKWIIMHDTEIFGEKDEAGEGPGLNQAIREFLNGNPIWSMVLHRQNNNGLTVLRHG